MSHGAKVVRDWMPGDGLRCSFQKQAAEGVPCGMPVKTEVQVVTSATRPDCVRKNPLCVNHAAARLGGVLPSQIRLEAEKRARERLLREHWDAYNLLIEAEIETIKAENDNVVQLARGDQGGVA